LADYSASDSVTGQLAWWLGQGGSASFEIPVDFERTPKENRFSTVSNVSIELQSSETAALMNEVPQAYRTQILDVLLTAFAAVIGRWTNRESIQMDVERHGRQPLFDDIDLSRTVGWFTSVFPLWLPHRPECGPGERLKLIKETLRQVPDDGVGHGLLRYLSPEAKTRAAMCALPRSQICFNYLGQRNDRGGLFTIEQEDVGWVRSPQGIRAYLLDVNLEIDTGRLRVNWFYSQAFHKKATIEELAAKFRDELLTLVEHCGQLDAGGRTPSDFPLANLDQTELDGLSQLLDKLDDEDGIND
jgi:non-ribosomal peptide synthase protein (TIGR01720 family)